MTDDPKDIRLTLLVPLYNRPEEIDELLHSLTLQTCSEFDVVVVEDGSDIPAEDIVGRYTDQLAITYVTKSNGGPGPARNFGVEHASGNYVVFLDSDCIIPTQYVASVLTALTEQFTDAFGGPDRAHESFTTVQKSINYSMTSLLTTGGIRGRKKSVEKFHPRSFNMGVSRAAFDALQGFSEMRFGEDVDFSMRLMEAGYSTQLIESAYVYHKRRTDYRKFFKQVFNSGAARVNLSKRHPGTLKAVHTLPSLFVVGSAILILLGFFGSPIFLLPLVLLFLVVFVDAAFKEHSVLVGLLSIIAVTVQMIGYGSGFIAASGWYFAARKGDFRAFEKNFYK